MREGEGDRERKGGRGEEARGRNGSSREVIGAVGRREGRWITHANIHSNTHAPALPSYHHAVILFPVHLRAQGGAALEARPLASSSPQRSAFRRSSLITNTHTQDRSLTH